MSKTIGGVMRYDLLAQQHRPKDPEALRKEVRRLAASQGLTPIDIAMTLRMDVSAVREMLAASGDEAAQLHREAWQR